MQIRCPECGKLIARDDMAISGHLRGKIHRDLTDKQRQKLRHDMCFMNESRFKTFGSSDKERDLCKSLGLRS